MATSDANALLLTVSADTNKLVKAMEKMSGTVTTHSRKAVAELTSLERFFNTKVDASKGLDKIIDTSRIKLLDTGVARIGLLGSALEELGPAGIAGAAGIAAIGLAVTSALDTAKWSEDLLQASRALGLTTSQLQEFDFIARQTGIPVENLRSSLAGLNKVIGDVETGIARKRTVSVFKTLLDIDPADLKKLGDVEHILPVILDHAAKLSTVGRAAVAGALKIDPGVLNSLIDSRDRLGELTAEAHKYGIVVDEDVIRRSAEAADKLKFASDIIDKNLKVAFADLADPIAKATLALAKFIHLLATLPTTHPRLAAGISDALAAAANVLVPGAGVAIRAATATRVRPVTMDEMLARIRNNPNASTDPTVPGAARHAKTIQDHTDELTKAAEEDLQRSLKALADAYKGLTDDVEKRAKFETDANDAEAAAEQAKLQGDLQKLLKDKTIDGALSDQLQAKIEQAQADTEAARQAKNRLVTRDAAEKIEDRQIETHKAIVEALLDQLQAEADIATTAAARNKIEKQILEIRQQLARDLEGTRLDRQVAHGEITPETAAREKGAQLTTQAAEVTTFDQAHAGAVKTYLHSIEDLNSVMQDAGVNAARSLADGLADAIVNAHSLGQVASNVFRQLISQILSAVLQQNVTGPILSSLFGIPGHAAGTSFAPGGLSLVGERGPELVRLPQGSQVMTTAQTQAALNIRSKDGGSIFAPVFDFRGAVVTQDLLDQANATAARLARAAGDSAVARSLVLGRKSLPTTLRSDALLRQ